MKEKTALIVEDEREILEILKEQVSAIAPNVLTAENGEIALDIIRRQPVDLVITDVSMPVLNGVELLSESRKSGIETPFVFLTALNDDENELSALRLGAFDFIEKPYDIQNLYKVIQKIFDLQKKEESIRELYDITSSPSLNYEEKVHELLEIGCDRIALDNGILALTEDTKLVITSAVGPLAKTLLGTRLDFSDGLMDKAYHTHSPVGIENISQSKWSGDKTAQSLKIASFLGTYIAVEGVPAGLLVFFSGTTRQKVLNESEKIFARLMAQWLGSELERKRSHESLSSLLKLSSDQKFALDQSSIVEISDKSGKIIYVNEKFCKITKYTPEELIGKSHQILKSGTQSNVFYQRMWGDILSGKTWRGELQNKAKDGSLYWIDMTIVPFLDKNKEPYQFMAISNDITERKNSEAIILRQQKQIFSSAKLTALGEMAGGIAHEINNPLTIIYGKAMELKRCLRQEAYNKEVAIQLIDAIESTSMRIGRIIKGLKNFSQDGSDDPLELVPLKSIVEDSLELCQERYKKHGIQLQVSDISDDIQITCRISQIEQVLINLLNNAHDAVMGLQEKWIRIEIADDIDFVRILITDSGKGLTKEAQEKLFQPFYTTKPVGKGTGLGLSIAKGVIEEHKGDLYLDTDCSNTRFIIKLNKSSCRLKNYKD